MSIIYLWGKWVCRSYIYGVNGYVDHIFMGVNGYVVHIFMGINGYVDHIFMG